MGKDTHTHMDMNIRRGDIYYADLSPVVGSEQGGLRPVLIVQGDKDPVVSMKDSEHAVKIYKDARLHVIPGAGHGFKPKEFEESLQQITLFLKED